MVFDHLYAPCPSSLKSSDRTFTNQVMFKLSQCPKDMKCKPTTGAGCINGFSEQFKSDLFIAEFLNYLNQVLEGSSEPIQFPNNQSISRSEHTEALRQFRSFS